MNIKDKKYILLDLDGTLLDSSRGIMNSFEKALAFFGESVLREKMREFIGPPLIHSFRDILGFPQETAEKMVAKYRERYIAEGVFEGEVYSGVLELLADLKKAGKTIILATSKAEPMSITATKHFGIYDYLSFIAADSYTGERNTKALVIQYAIDKMEIKNLDEVVMVGDTKYDMEGASKVGVSAVGVLYGFGTREELEKFSPEYICENVLELREVLL